MSFFRQIKSLIWRIFFDAFCRRSRRSGWRPQTRRPTSVCQWGLCRRWTSWKSCRIVKSSYRFCQIGGTIYTKSLGRDGNEIWQTKTGPQTSNLYLVIHDFTKKNVKKVFEFIMEKKAYFQTTIISKKSYDSAVNRSDLFVLNWASQFSCTVWKSEIFTLTWKNISWKWFHDFFAKC